CVIKKVLERSRAVFTEAMVIAYDNLLCSYFSYKHFTDIFLGREVGEIPGERGNDEVVYPRIGEPLHFFINIANDAQAIVFRVEDEAQIGRASCRERVWSELDGMRSGEYLSSK